jgi:hypothetical protein
LALALRDLFGLAISLKGGTAAIAGLNHHDDRALLPGNPRPIA